MRKKDSIVLKFLRGGVLLTGAGKGGVAGGGAGWTLELPQRQGA